MIKRCILFVLLAFCVTASADDLDVRHFYITNNVQSPLSAAMNQYFYTGESLRFDLWAVRGSSPVPLTQTNLVALWEFSQANNPLSLVVTGSVMNATNGYIAFASLPVALTNTVLDSRVKLYQAISGTNEYIGVIYAAKAFILPASSTINTNYVGPFPDNL